MVVSGLVVSGLVVSVPFVASAVVSPLVLSVPFVASVPLVGAALVGSALVGASGFGWFSDFGATATAPWLFASATFATRATAALSTASVLKPKAVAIAFTSAWTFSTARLMLSGMARCDLVDAVLDHLLVPDAQSEENTTQAKSRFVDATEGSLGDIYGNVENQGWDAENALQVGQAGQCSRNRR